MIVRKLMRASHLPLPLPIPTYFFTHTNIMGVTSRSSLRGGLHPAGRTAVDSSARRFFRRFWSMRFANCNAQSLSHKAAILFVPTEHGLCAMRGSGIFCAQPNRWNRPAKVFGIATFWPVPRCQGPNTCTRKICNMDISVAGREIRNPSAKRGAADPIPT